MKALLPFLFFICMATTSVFGQIKIGDNPQNIDPASVLELESDSKVLVITRVNTANMNAINPQRGGMVYNTDTECIHYYDGTTWINLCDAVSFSITNDPLVNTRSTISITETPNNYNLEIEPGSIRSVHIATGGINGTNIQDNSIGQAQLGQNSVGLEELRDNSVGSEELRDGTIRTEDFDSDFPNQQLVTDEFGVVQWVESDELFDLTFNKADTTLQITRSTVPGISSVNLGALIGSDDQTLTLTPNNRLQIENGNEIDLSFLNNPGSDSQTLTLSANDVLSITGGNTVNLSKYLNTDNQQLSISGNTISLTNGSSVTLPAATVNTDNQQLSLAGNNLLSLTNGGTPINLSRFLDNTDDQELQINGNQLTITGLNGGNTITLPANTVNTDEQDLSLTGNVLNISGGTGVTLPDADATNELSNLTYDTNTNILTLTNPFTPGNQVNLSGLAGGSGTADGSLTDVTLTGTDLVFTSSTGGFSGAVPLATLASGGSADGVITNIELQNDTDLVFSGTAPGFSGTIDLSSLAATPSLEEVLTQGNNAGANPIIGLDISTDPTSAATRGYVDANLGGTQDLAGILSNGNSAGNSQINDLLDPTLPQDAATQNYVETRIATILGSGGADGVVSNISPSVTGFDVTGTNGGFTGSINLDAVFATDVDVNTGLILKEDAANKSNDVTLADATNTLFPTELAVKTYVDNQIGTISAPTIVSADADNAISVSAVDGGAFYDDSALVSTTAANATAITANSTAITAKEDAANKSNDVTLADATNTLFPTQLAVKTYVDAQISGISAGDNLSNSNLIQTEAIRTYEVGQNESLVFTGLGNIGFGNGANPPLSKFHFAGEIRVQGVNSTDGTVTNPSYNFVNDTDNNTGIYRPAADEIGFSTGGFEALRIDEYTTSNTQVLVEEKLGVGFNLPPNSPYSGIDVNSTFQVNGSVSMSIRSSNNINETISDNDYTIIIGSTTSNIILPAANSDNIGRIYIIKNLSSSTPNITDFVDSSGNTVSNLSINSVVQLQSDGTDWQQIN